MGRFKCPGYIVKEEEEEALQTTKRWQDRERTIYTDGPRLDIGKVWAVEGGAWSPSGQERGG